MKPTQRILLTILLLATVLTMQAQMQDPVHFKSELKTGKNAEAEIVFTATIDQGWHVYSTDLGQDGPIEATFNVVKMDGAEKVGKLTPKGNVIKKYDEMFGMELKYFEHQVTFVQKIRFTKPKYDIDCYLEYGACNDQSCLPPTQVELSASGEVKSEKGEVKNENEEMKNADVRAEATVTDTATADTISHSSLLISNSGAEGEDLWSPVISELQAFSSSKPLSDHSLLYILLMGFVGGLLAVCMPCIWPIIPMTVSFFLKRAKSNRSKAITDAVTYGVSIIVIYLGLGLLVTALFGSDTLNAMSTNAVFNIFLFLLLVVFALSFFGWFEIKLPGSWANKVDQKSEEFSAKASTGSKLSTLNSPHGLHAGARLVLVYGTHHRPVARRDDYQWQLAGSCRRHVRLRRSPGPAVHVVCPVPLVAETGTEIRFVDDDHQGGSRFHRTGLRPEVLLRSRPGLRLASDGP